jgi:hypothetical protein
MSGYIGVQPVPKATQRREYFTATNGQTSFSTSGYTPEYIDVYMNGVKLSPADFTATNGSDVVLGSGAATGDLLQIISFLPFSVLNQAFSGTLSVAGAVTAAGGTMTGNLSFGDNNKAIFGAGSDLQIFHDGSNSFINEVGTGDLSIKASNNLYLMSGSSEIYAKFTTDGASTLYHNNAAKLATNSGGATVTGTLLVDGLSMGDNETAYFGTDNDLRILHTGSHGQINNTVGDLTLDVAGDLILDSDSPNWRFKDNGTSILEIGADSQNPVIYAAVADKDIQFKGNDGGSTITALTLDMSEAGRANFNNDISLNDGRVLRLGTGDDTSIYNDGSHFNIVNTTTNHDIMFKGNDDGANIILIMILGY